MHKEKSAPRVLEIATPSDDASLNICLDTVAKGKQALVFCNTKRGAEAQAERTAHEIERKDPVLEALAEDALGALATPTKQCRRLATCLKKGIAFHHAGLHPKQREIVETKFREGVIKVICSTPTLAMGLDMPAFRVVIRDLKRFGDSGAWGMTEIPVLEYHQMAGRAGRPGKEAYGEAIVLAENEGQKEQRIEKYIRGEAEEIYSKLAVEPVLRTYVLSLIASEFVTTTSELYDFFGRTFYAKQYGDMRRLRSILDAMVLMLEDWEFIQVSDQGADERPKKPRPLFVSANEIRDGRLRATPLGKRVAELYLDPYTGHFLITCFQKASPTVADFPLLQMLSSCLELRPLLRPRARELDEIMEKSMPHLSELLVKEPVQYSEEYEEFLQTLKTALFMKDWVEEVYEDALLEQYGVAPGEVHTKLERADWLLYASEEIVRILSLQHLRTPLAKLRLRLKHGAKEELLPLLQLKNIGRVRARKLFAARIRTIGDIKEAEASTLAALVGKQIAIDIKRQVGQELDPSKVKVPTGKRVGQKSVADFGED